MGVSHSVNRERSRVARKKHRKRKLKEAKNKKAVRTKKEALRAYFKGFALLHEYFLSTRKDK